MIKSPERLTNSPNQRLRAIHVDTRVARWLIPVLLVAVAITMVSLHVHLYTKVGPIDELQHIDYLYKSPAVVAPGDRIGQDAMREEACRGIDYPNFPLPACSTTARYNAGEFQEKGYNTASANTPLYYSITHFFAAGLQRVAGVGDLVTAGRLVGGLWLGAGLVIALLAGRRLGASRWSLAALLVTIACVPAVVYPSSTISPDAASFTVGAGVLWVTLWWEERPQHRWPALLLVTVCVLALKMTNIVALAAAGIYMLLRLIQLRMAPADGLGSTDRSSGPQSVRPWVTGGVVLAASAVATAAGWLAIQAALAHGDPRDVPMNQLFATSSLRVSPLVGNLGNWITPLSNAWASVGNPELTTVLQRIGPLLIAAGILAAAILGEGALRIRALAWACLGTAFFGATVFIVVSFYAQSVYFPPPARYGDTLVPVMTVLTALSVKTRPAKVVLGLVAVASVILSIVRLA